MSLYHLMSIIPFCVNYTILCQLYHFMSIIPSYVIISSYYTILFQLYQQSSSTSSSFGMGAGIGSPNRQKSCSESNLLEMGGDPFHSTDTLQPETNPLQHAVSSGAVNNQGNLSGFMRILDALFMWVRGLIMAINANSATGVRFPACARSRMLTLDKLANLNHSLNGGLLLD